MIDMLLVLVLCVEFAVLGGTIGELIGYRRGIRKMAREAHGFISQLNEQDLLKGEAYCTECNGPLPYHRHGRPVAKRFNLLTYNDSI